eukprot:Seg1603.9 transcript_id=Seg1603.9/GoldUCD/mRNA.D3Y31 product="hypothetical protein" protein_id=Seg1603.9/GoldUCD/D3Y31
MLYTSWKDETKLTNGFDTYQESYEQLEDQIIENRQQYEGNSHDFDEAIESVDANIDDTYYNVAPSAQHADQYDEYVSARPSQQFGCFQPGVNPLHNQYDLMTDFGIFPRTNDQEIQNLYKLDDAQYRNLLRSLNKQQKEFFYHVLHLAKKFDRQMTLFLSGGAGVGKSRLSNALYEAFTRHYDHVVGGNPDELKILKLAPT